YVPGEGSGAVLLKPLASAIRDGDTIYAIVEGSAANNDGSTMGVTTPNPDAQRDVIVHALRQAKVSAADISYIEAHGTGTMIGDPIELRALTDVFRKITDEQQFCGVGSVKSNIGHLLCAAGVAGFVKVVLSLYHNLLPPTLNCEYPNPRFDFETSPFYPNIRLSEWLPRNGLRRAGISSFGFAGTNVHAVLSEFVPERYSLSYRQQRKSLPPVQFNKRRFWIDKKHFPSADSTAFVKMEQNFLHANVKPFMELVDETV
ncbi:MAG: polyketide synthase, partial [Candidatus Thiodiazotropha sp.]